MALSGDDWGVDKNNFPAFSEKIIPLKMFFIETVMYEALKR